MLPSYLGADNWFSRFTGAQMERSYVLEIITGSAIIPDLNAIWHFGAGEI